MLPHIYHGGIVTDTTGIQERTLARAYLVGGTMRGNPPPPQKLK